MVRQWNVVVGRRNIGVLYIFKCTPKLCVEIVKNGQSTENVANIEVLTISNHVKPHLKQAMMVQHSMI